MIPLAGRRIQDLFAELITAEEVEVAGPGGDFDRLECLAEGSAFFWLRIEKFSEIVITFNFY